MTLAALDKRSWTRSDGIDLLRGLAIVFVIFNHVNMRLRFAHVPYTRGLPPQLVYSLVWNSQRGVQIFFAVSGFLITSTSLRRWGSLSRIRLGQFYRLRFARIAPLFLLLLAVLSALHLAGARNFVVPAKTGGLLRALFAACTFHLNLLEARRGYLPANWDILWSLSVEEMFYFFFPLLCRLLGRGKLLIAVLLIFVVLGPFGRTVCTGGNETWVEYSYLGSMDAIALGCLTALVPWRPGRGARWAVCGAGLLLLVFSLGFSLRAARLGLDRMGLSMSLVALGACMVMLVNAPSRWKSPRLLAPLLLLGRRSYEVYLTHMFLVIVLFEAFLKRVHSVRMVPLLFLVVLVSAGALGALVARYYSEPINRRLRRGWGNGLRETGLVREELEPEASPG